MSRRLFVLRVSLLLLMGLVSSLVLFRVVVSNVHHGYIGDFTIFWLVGQNPVDWLYTDLRALPFPYPPSSLWLFKPLAELPLFASLALWDVAGLAAFAVACRRIAEPLPILVGVFTIAVGTNLVHGQTGLIVGALVILGITEKRPWVAGILLGTAAAIKPQSVIAVPLALLLTKEYRTLLWAGATGALLVALSVLVWGITPWMHWISALDDFRALVAERDIQTVGLWPFGLLLAPFALLNFRKDRYSSIVIAGVLLSPYSMPYDLAGLTVVATAMLLDGKRRPVELIGAALVFSSVFATGGIAVLALSGVWNRERRDVPPAIADRARFGARTAG